MILKKRQTLSEFFRKNPLKKISSETKRRQKLTKKIESRPKEQGSALFHSRERRRHSPEANGRVNIIDCINPSERINLAASFNLTGNVSTFSRFYGCVKPSERDSPHASFIIGNTIGDVSRILPVALTPKEKLNPAYPSILAKAKNSFHRGK